MFYAVRVGRTPGIYKTWAECESQVKGFKGAQFKKFENEADALSFLKQEVVIQSLPQKKNFSKKEYFLEEKNDFYKNLDSTKCHAFVDGSYNIETENCGAGVIIAYNNKTMSLAELLCDSPTTSMRNVYGEIRAAELAIEWALENEIKNLVIYHDYEGISKWCTGEWKTKKERTEEYKNFFQKASNYVNISFCHIPGHTGNIGNEEADMVAKAVCGVEN